VRKEEVQKKKKGEKRVHQGPRRSVVACLAAKGKGDAGWGGKKKKNAVSAERGAK